ncbi:MAG: hypothetical protein AAFV95_24990 [Bacteroidota bacterium]
MKSLKQIPFLCLALLLCLATACDKDDDDMGNSDLCEGGRLVMLDKEQFDNGPSDPFTIEDVSIDGDCLSIRANYSGGCGGVIFELFDSEGIGESDPITRQLRLSLDDNDPCEGALVLDLLFDLTPLQVDNESSMSLSIDGWDKRQLYEY